MASVVSFPPYFWIGHTDIRSPDDFQLASSRIELLPILPPTTLSRYISSHFVLSISRAHTPYFFALFLLFFSWKFLWIFCCLSLNLSTLLYVKVNNTHKWHLYKYVLNEREWANGRTRVRCEPRPKHTQHTDSSMTTTTKEKMSTTEMYQNVLAV